MWTCKNKKCRAENYDNSNYCSKCGWPKERNVKRRNLKAAIIATFSFIIIVIGVWIINLSLHSTVKAEYADIVRLKDYYSFLTPAKKDAYIALRTDGSVKTVGLSEWFSNDEINQIESWKNVVQIGVYKNNAVIALKANGDVVSTQINDDENNPNTWSNVSSLIIGNNGCYALTRDGRVLADSSALWGSNPTSWVDVKRLVYYAYPESSGVFGLRSDGSVYYNDYYPFFGTPKDVVDIDSSGYIFCCVEKDGAIVIGGHVPEDDQSLVREAGNIGNVVQAVTFQYVIACRLHDGTVQICGKDFFPESRSWHDIIDIQKVVIMDVEQDKDHPGNVDVKANLVGLCANGQVVFSPGSNNDSALSIQTALSGWKDIVKIKACDGYILGWQRNGALLAAGIDLNVLN